MTGLLRARPGGGRGSQFPPVLATLCAPAATSTTGASPTRPSRDAGTVRAWVAVAIVFAALAALVALTGRTDQEPTSTTWFSGDGDTVVITPRAVPG